MKATVWDRFLLWVALPLIVLALAAGAVACVGDVAPGDPSHSGRKDQQ